MKKVPEIVVAVDELAGFGKDGQIPWHLPEDQKRFKELTTGHVCIMGRLTYHNMLDMRVARDAKNNVHDPITEILRGRESYVVTSDPNYPTPGATKVDSLLTVMNRMNSSNDSRRLFVLGGKQMFISALSWNPIVHMTVVKGPVYDCDVFFPIDSLNKKYRIVSGEETEKAYYVVYQRK